MSFCLISTTFPNEASAKSMIKLLLEQKLVACAQMMPIQSFYHWEGKLCEEPEYLVIMKTQVEHFEAIKALVVAHHPYKIPQLIQVPIEKGLEAYLTWIAHETAKEES